MLQFQIYLNPGPSQLRPESNLSNFLTRERLPRPLRALYIHIIPPFVFLGFSNVVLTTPAGDAFVGWLGR
jgi:hypothetical protein